MTQRDWPDIEFSAVATPHESYVEFAVYEIEGIMEGSKPLWHKQGSPCFPDPVDSIEEAELFLHGSVRWDGCSNWYFNEQDRAMLHGCGRNDLAALGEVMCRCWDWAREILP